VDSSDPWLLLLLLLLLLPTAAAADGPSRSATCSASSS
jgi:hypothetical protein